MPWMRDGVSCWDSGYKLAEELFYTPVSSDRTSSDEMIFPSHRSIAVEFKALTSALVSSMMLRYLAVRTEVAALTSASFFL